ncbi:MAG: DUF4173 domain-containing protein [Deltaproteobacteria bacterium]|nr:DUF4173 domain-containing protein [Deltaproteobacteria bacterium]
MVTGRKHSRRRNPFFLLPLIARAKIASLTFSDIAKETLFTVATVPIAPINLLRDDLKVGEAAVGARSYLRKPMLGALLASPLLLVFVLLFSSADPVFASLVKDPFSFEGFGEGKTGAILVVGVLYSAVLLAFTRRAGTDAPNTLETREKAYLGSTELGTVVVLLSALFALFMWIQVRQVLGFHEALAIPGVTYSSSAREGFFQLMAVTVLVSSVVLVVDWLALGSDTLSLRRLRIALMVLVALTLGVASSALWRMHLYNDAYGYTQLRFF